MIIPAEKIPEEDGENTMGRLRKALINGIRTNVLQWISRDTNGTYFMAYMETIDFLNDLERTETNRPTEQAKTLKQKDHI